MPPKQGKSAAAVVDSTNVVEDATAVRQAAMVSSTFANIELVTSRQTLKQVTNLYDDARIENQRLASELVERDKDSMKVVQFLRAELDGKNQEIANLQKQAKADLDRIRSSFSKERVELLAEIDKREVEMSDLREENAKLAEEIAGLEAFSKEREQLHAEFQAFREQHKTQCERYDREISRLRFMSLEEKIRVKAEERSMVEKFEAEVSDRAMHLLDCKTKDIHKENFALLQDKILLERELDRITAQCKTAEASAGSQRREVELAKVADEEYSKRCAKQSREIKDLRAQAKVFEGNIAKLIDEYEHKLEVMQHQSQEEIQKLKDERDMAYRNAETRHKELVKMRQLSKTIVRQRSELETFFNEALEYVRNEVVKERQIALREKLMIASNPTMRTNNGGRPPWPPSSSGTQGPPLPLPPPRSTSGPASTVEAERGSSALIHNTHPFFHRAEEGGGQFDSIYQGAPDDPPSTASSSVRALVPSSPSGGLPPIKPSSEPAGYPGGYSTVGGKRGQAGKGPQQQGGSRTDVPESDADFSNLSWLDKERVLRILLAKINNASRYERAKLEPPESSTGMRVVVPVGVQSMPARSEMHQGGASTFVTQNY